MNTLNIGDTIFKLRKEKGITQEQLANKVGISAGAVCKWETGNSIPDITILAPIARALGVTIDTLLSFSPDLSEEEVANIKKELTTIFTQSGYEAGEVKCRDYLNEYPNSTCLKLCIAGLFQMFAMMTANESEELYKSRLKQTLSLLKEVTESNETKYVSQGLFVTASIHMMLENYDECEKVLRELRESYVDPMSIYPMLLQRQGKNEEAKLLCEQLLLSNLNSNAAMLSTLARIALNEENNDQAFLCVDAMQKLQNLFNMGLHTGDYNLCTFYLRTKQPELAARWFKIYVKGLLSSGYDYSNHPFFKDIKLEVEAGNQVIIRKRMFQSHIEDPELKVMSGISDYEDAILLLKAAL